MKRWFASALVFVLSVFLLRAEEDLPQPDTGQPFEIEPPLLIQTRDGNGSPDIPTPPEHIDLAKIETDLARARKNAASGDRLFRAGIIAKVEAEERVLKVVRLEARLAEAQLEAARVKLEEQKTQARVVEIEAQLRAGENHLAEAARAAERATQEKRRAELEAALKNLQRQKKLLALGSGRRSDVNRAEKKLAELQGAEN